MGVRKNASTLTATEKARLIAALRQLTNYGRNDEYVAQHRDLFNAGIHANPRFLLWNREFLHLLAPELQRIETYLLPYL